MIEKPFGWDLESARELNGLLATRLRRDGDLPHRPLPGQGDRPEHAGTAVRERHLRARLEPPVHRPRPDHGRRVDRDREPRRLLREVGRDPRRLPEPPAPTRRPDRDGAADRLQRRVGAEREGEGAALASHAGPQARRARPVRDRAGSRERRSPATAKSRASPPTRRPTRSSRPSSSSTAGAGPTRRSTYGRESGWPGARRRSRSSSSARRIRPSRRSPAKACGPTSSSSTSSRTRACRSRSGRRCRAEG